MGVAGSFSISAIVCTSTSGLATSCVAVKPGWRAGEKVCTCGITNARGSALVSRTT